MGVLSQTLQNLLDRRKSVVGLVGRGVWMWRLLDSEDDDRVDRSVGHPSEVDRAAHIPRGMDVVGVIGTGILEDSLTALHTRCREAAGGWPSPSVRSNDAFFNIVIRMAMPEPTAAVTDQEVCRVPELSASAPRRFTVLRQRRGREIPKFRRERARGADDRTLAGLTLKR